MKAKITTLIALACLIRPIYADDDLSIVEAWARDTPPGAPNGAVYFKLKNESQSEEQLIRVSSNVSEHSEMHSHVLKDGVMQMRQSDVINIPAGDEVVFEPGGHHVMLINLTQVLELGDTILLDFEFTRVGVVQIEVPVMREAPQ